jgi:CBS domain-containing protein/SAM-dependent methyltransferase
MNEERIAVTVGDIMTPLRDAVGEADSVLDAARKMVQLRVPAIPVVGERDVFRGMLTNRDIVELVVQERDPRETKAAELGHGDAAVRTGDSLETLVGALKDHRGGRLAVADESGVLVGVVSQRDVDAFLRVREELGPGAGEVLTEVSPRDEFSRVNRGAHLLAALSALHCIRDAMAAAGVERVGSILDFPCGYGRVLRVLKAAFPDAELGAGDLERDGVDFCATVLGATPIYSDPDPGKVEIPRRFDLIWCGSLLTHFAADRWDGFLALLRDALTPNGLLVFTTHGPRDDRTLRRFGMTGDQIRDMQADFEAEGFAYADYEHVSGWGIALATEEWTRARVAAVPGLRLVSYAGGGWDAPAPRQDVIACVSADG